MEAVTTVRMRQVSRAQLFGLWALLVAAAVVALSLLANLVITICWAATGRTSVTLAGANSIPLADSVRTLGPEVDSAGSGTTLELLVKDIPANALVMNLLAQVLGGLAAITVCLAIVVVCWRLVRGVPFSRSVTKTTVYVGSFLLVVGVVSPIFSGVAKMSIVNSFDNVVSTQSPIGLGSLDAYIFESIAALPLVLGIVLLLLTAVFAKGAQLQRDSEGLV